MQLANKNAKARSLNQSRDKVGWTYGIRGNAVSQNFLCRVNVLMDNARVGYFNFQLMAEIFLHWFCVGKKISE